MRNGADRMTPPMPDYDGRMSQFVVRYFAAAAEAAGVEEETFDTASAPTLEALGRVLAERYGEQMARVLRRGSFLVDGVTRSDGAIDGATVDVLPPFAGG